MIELPARQKKRHLQSSDGDSLTRSTEAPWCAKSSPFAIALGVTSQRLHWIIFRIYKEESGARVAVTAPPLEGIFVGQTLDPDIGRTKNISAPLNG